MDETYDLALVQSEDYSREFRYRYPNSSYLDFSLCEPQAQLRGRESETGPLLLDLTPYLSVKAGDNLTLVLKIPGAATSGQEAKAFAKAAWDLFLLFPGSPPAQVRMLQGAVTLDPAATLVSA